jgi:hypothetical protein
MKIAQSHRSCAPFIASFAMSGSRVKIVAERGRSDAQRPEALSNLGTDGVFPPIRPFAEIPKRLDFGRGLNPLCLATFARAWRPAHRVRSAPAN